MRNIQTFCFDDASMSSIGETYKRFVLTDCLVGLVVKTSATRAEDPGFESRLRRDFSGVESYQ